MAGDEAKKIAIALLGGAIARLLGWGDERAISTK